MFGITLIQSLEISGLEFNSTTPWPSDLTGLDYFLWSTVKSMMYETPVLNVKDLKSKQTYDCFHPLYEKDYLNVLASSF